MKTERPFIWATIIFLSLISVSLAIDPWQIYDKLDEKYRVKSSDTYMQLNETYTIYTNMAIPSEIYMMSTNEDKNILLFFTTNNPSLQYLLSESTNKTADAAGSAKASNPTTGSTVPPKANTSGGQ